MLNDVQFLLRHRVAEGPELTPFPSFPLALIFATTQSTDHTYLMEMAHTCPDT